MKSFHRDSLAAAPLGCAGPPCPGCTSRASFILTVKGLLKVPAPSYVFVSEIVRAFEFVMVVVCDICGSPKRNDIGSFGYCSGSGGSGTSNSLDGSRNSESRCVSCEAVFSPPLADLGPARHPASGNWSRSNQCDTTTAGAVWFQGNP